MRRGREATGGPASAWGCRGALEGMTSKTAVLPGFCVIECGGGGSAVTCGAVLPAYNFGGTPGSYTAERMASGFILAGFEVGSNS